MTVVVHILSLLLLLCAALLVMQCRPSVLHMPEMGTSASVLLSHQQPMTFLNPVQVVLQPLPVFVLTTNPTLSPQLTLEPPTCYAQTSAITTCLGRITNSLQMTLEHVRIVVRMGTSEQSVTPEQTTIQPGAFAPYRVQFATPAQPATVQAVWQTTRPHASTARLLNGYGMYAPRSTGYGMYTYTVTVAAGEEPLEDARLIVSLLDDTDQLAGYRVVMLGSPLAAGAQRTLTTLIVPQILSERYTVVATLDTP